MFLKISVHLSEAWRVGCASCRILGMLGSIGLYVTTKGTLWSDFDLVLSARASSLVTNEAFLIASCMHLFLCSLWMRWCSISFVRCWKRFYDEQMQRRRRAGQYGKLVLVCLG